MADTPDPDPAPQVLNRRTPCCRELVNLRAEGEREVTCPHCRARTFLVTVAPSSLPWAAEHGHLSARWHS